MIETIIKTSKSDGHLAALVEDSREYAQIYLLANGVINTKKGDIHGKEQRTKSDR